MHAHQDSFHRFDKFNLKYNPIGESRLREIFLKNDNYIQGRYLAELTQGKSAPHRVRSVYNDLPCRGHDRSRAEQVPSEWQHPCSQAVRGVSSSQKSCEWRISIYGRKRDEWDKLAKWIVDNKLYSHNVRWLIQVPRLYDVYKQNGSIETFEDIVRSAYFRTILSRSGD